MRVDISLPKELEKQVRERVQRGDYDDADALVQEAVHRLIEEGEGDLDAIRLRLQRADAEIDRGEALEFDECTSQDLARVIHDRGIRRSAEAQNAGARR